MTTVTSDPERESVSKHPGSCDSRPIVVHKLYTEYKSGPDLDLQRNSFLMASPA